MNWRVVLAAGDVLSRFLLATLALCGAASAKGSGPRSLFYQERIQQCAASTGAQRDPDGNGYVGSSAVMAAFRACRGVEVDPGASDPKRAGCAEQAGVTYSYKAHRYVGPHQNMMAWLDCMGFSRDRGATDPVSVYCASTAGVTFDRSSHGYTGSSSSLRRFRQCLGTD